MLHHANKLLYCFQKSALIYTNIYLIPLTISNSNSLAFLELKHFSLEKKHILRSLKNEKAAGIDMVPVEMI